MPIFNLMETILTDTKTRAFMTKNPNCYLKLVENIIPTTYYIKTMLLYTEKNKLRYREG